MGCLSLAATAKRLQRPTYLATRFRHASRHRPDDGPRGADGKKRPSDGRTSPARYAECPKVLYAEPAQKWLITRPDTTQITALLEPAIRR